MSAMAFTAGSNSPYVTDLGQDTGSKNPPDFVLHVRQGQDYGFPTCNHTRRQCASFAQPFRSFRAHVDLMGIAVHTGTLYLSSFMGSKGKGPGGEVFSLRIKGGHLYVGELTGQVFRVKV